MVKTETRTKRDKPGFTMRSRLLPLRRYHRQTDRQIDRTRPIPRAYGVYVCIYARTRTYACTVYVRVCACTRKYVHVRTHTYTYVCVRAHTTVSFSQGVYVRARTCAYVHTYRCTYAHNFKQAGERKCMYMHVHARMCT